MNYYLVNEDKKVVLVMVLNHNREDKTKGIEYH